MGNFTSTKVLELGSCAFRQPNAAINRPNGGTNSRRCSYIHGYQLKAKFWFKCTNLDDRNWCQDFGAFGYIKDILKAQFDHTTCLSFDDPLLEEFEKLHDLGGIDLRVMPKGTGIERIAEWCYDTMQDFVSKQSEGRVWVEQVEVFEHENNSAIYKPEPITILLEHPHYVKEQVETPVEVPTTTNSSSPEISRGAPINNDVTPNKTGWFSGTSWQ